MKSGIDKIFLLSVFILLILGFGMFVSASMGTLATSGSAQFMSLIFKQGFFGIVLGLIACFLCTRMSYKTIRAHALSIFAVSIFVTALVLVPGIGTRINGARRWIVIAKISFQPVALLNIGFIIYWAAWIAYVKDKIKTFKYGLLPLAIILSIIGVLLLSQPDTDSFLIICLTGVAMLLIAGGNIKHILSVGAFGVLCLAILALMRPYVMSRLQTFVNPSDNTLTTGYQVQQSLIAVGSGQIFGRGWGQSIQKYKFLPESTNDSIFAVVGEELGFIGSVFVIGVFLFFLFRGFRIAVRAPDAFSGLLVSGIVILIAAQSFINIASVLGVIPFSGIPLAFFSEGGTSMLLLLAQMGIVLNISKYNKVVTV